MNISPRQLRMFLALSESLNFSNTAERLLITQPSLSKVNRDLEAGRGLALFERTTRSVQLTAGGARLATIARTIVGEYEAGLQRMQSTAEQAAVQLSIAAWPSLAQGVLPEVCAALELTVNAPRITVHDCANSMCIQRLLNHDVDFALASVAPSHPDLQYQELLRDRFVALSHGRWREQVPQRIGLEELMHLPLITLTDASTAMRYMSAAYLNRGIEYRPKMQVEQMATVIALVKKEIGVAVLPYLGTKTIHSVNELQTSEISDGPLRSVGIVTRRLGTPTAIAMSAMQQVRAVSQRLIQQNPGWILPPSAALAPAMSHAPDRTPQS
jgi:DNA-binding transcriptional LysR family regulator